MDSKRTSKVSATRLGRLGKMGGLIGGIVGGALREGAGRLAKGERSSMRDLMLTPANLERVATQMAQLRGAAMKVGQLLSMDSGQLMPPELSQLMDRLRSDADAMPPGQLKSVLQEAWGAQWQNQFSEFDFRPFAAASIGQVHRGVLSTGERVAIKIQYPGIRRSIDSDVDNVALLLRLVNIVPKEFELAPLLEEAKHQLHQEADYRQEASFMSQYAASLMGFDRFNVPTPISALTTERVLVMTWCEGVAIDQLVQASAAVRNQIVHDLMHLFFHELFLLQKVQTDPNFANFLYDHSTQQIQLLDFGATRVYTNTMVDAYRDLLRCALLGDREGSFSAAQRIGYFSGAITEAQQTAVLELFELVLEPLRSEVPYDFGQSNLAQRVREVGLRLSFEQEYWHSPPVAALFLHRKLAGLYLLAVRLQAVVDLRPLRFWLEGTSGAYPEFLKPSAPSL